MIGEWKREKYFEVNILPTPALPGKQGGSGLYKMRKLIALKEIL